MNDRECMGGPWDGRRVVKAPIMLDDCQPGLIVHGDMRAWSPDQFTPVGFNMPDDGVYVFDIKRDVWEWIPMPRSTRKMGAG